MLLEFSATLLDSKHGFASVHVPSADRTRKLRLSLLQSQIASSTVQDAGGGGAGSGARARLGWSQIQIS